MYDIIFGYLIMVSIDYSGYYLDWYEGRKVYQRLLYV